jgi:hypothetical protein
MHKTIAPGFLIATICLLQSGLLSMAANPVAPLMDPSGALAVIDLASESAWTLRLDDGPPRPIKVPGGGWNSDQQEPPIQVMREVRDFVRYERSITVPAVAAGQAVVLRFGAVAHGCEVLLDGKKVGEHHGPQVAFEMDLTENATPGKPQVLQVKAYHRRHYIKTGHTAQVAVGWDFSDGDDEASKAEAKEWCAWAGNSKVGYGITRSISLVVLPAVHLAEVFVRPSVTRQQLSADVWVRNDTNSERKLTVEGVLASWSRRSWQYPVLAPVQVAVAAHATAKVTLGPVAWTLGPESYWWPNIPYREDYQPQLHFLNLQVKEGGTLHQRYPQRFGFVEHAEGPYYYTVNGVRTTGISDATAEGQVSFYDAYVSPAWLPPTGPGTGAPESWRRYMRLGINTNRLHCSPPTEYMMQAADEVGFLIIPEAPIWGNTLSRYNPQYTPQTYQDMGRACRNHPSIARYSLANEVRDNMEEWRPAIDDMREVDDSRPLVFDMDGHSDGRLDGIKGGHAIRMWHYQNIHEKITPDKGICGMGESYTETNGMGNLAIGVRTMRMNDFCYMSGWSWINYWPNFLQGMSHDLHAWKVNNAADHRDGIDGWGSPIVDFVQQSFHPYLVQDHIALKQNPGEPVQLGAGKIRWPYQNSACAAGKPVERLVEVFNGGLSGNRLTLVWSLRWDKPDGPQAIPGGTIDCQIEPGFHATQKVAFTAPALEVGQDERNVYLILESRKDGQTVFRDDTLCLTLRAKILPGSAQFIGVDETTKGNWRGKYGAEGHLLVGKENALPAFAEFSWKSGEPFIYAKETDDPRALEFFQNAVAATTTNRIAAIQFGNQVVFELNAGTTPRRLSIYQVDWDKQGRVQEILIVDETGRTLDKQTVKAFSGGCYLSWTVQGKIRVAVGKITYQSAGINGIFLDLSNK